MLEEQSLDKTGTNKSELLRRADKKNNKGQTTRTNLRSYKKSVWPWKTYERAETKEIFVDLWTRSKKSRNKVSATKQEEKTKEKNKKSSLWPIYLSQNPWNYLCLMGRQKYMVWLLQIGAYGQCMGFRHLLNAPTVNVLASKVKAMHLIIHT